VEVIRLDKKNTVKSLRDQLFTLMSSGNDDGGFPILRVDGNDDGMRMVGYIGANELEHALSTCTSLSSSMTRSSLFSLGIVADEAEDEVHFHTTYSHNMVASSVSSLLEGATDPTQDPFDFSAYMDQVSFI
jgi:chloride channel 3/4/5